jgi:endonuclease YncB( thermonuclease family)
MHSCINQISLKKCRIAALLCLGLMLVLATLQNYSQEILARCPNGYHKSPSGDCEKYDPHKGLPRCDNGYHRSSSGHCEKVGGSNGSSKKCSSGYHKDENTGKCKKVSDEKTLTQIKSIANGTGNSQDQTDVFTTKELNIFTNRTCQGFSGCFEGTVTKVVDGDTLDINNIRIRLALVNTPETNQDGYLQAKQFVESNCGIGTHAMVDEDDGQKAGSYGRMIGLVFCERLDPSLNKAILTSGNAEVLAQFCGVSEFSTKDWAQQYGC